ncbi:MAG: hypothetical protein WBD47_07425, partial [Phormidesmis sp.]
MTNGPITSPATASAETLYRQGTGRIYKSPQSHRAITASGGFAVGDHARTKKVSAVFCDSQPFIIALSQ